MTVSPGTNQTNPPHRRVLMPLWLMVAALFLLLFSLYLLISHPVSQTITALKPTPTLSATPIPPTHTSTVTLTLTRTYTPTNTRTPDLLRTRFAGVGLTLTAAPTHTLTPTVTATLVIPPPVANSTLSKTGPWLLISFATSYTGPSPYIRPRVLSSDGSGWQPLALPYPIGEGVENPEMAWWTGDISPHGGYLAMQGYFNEYFAECDKDAEPFTTIPSDEKGVVILKLPENKIIRSINNLGLEAYNQILIDNCNPDIMSDDGVPPVLAVTSNYSSLHWSSDGRYLAFPGAPETPSADIYLYDTQSDTVRRLTMRANNAFIMDWSPDGQYIIYQGVSKYAWFHSQVLKSSGIYSVSLDGKDRLILKQDGGIGRPFWLSDTQFLIEEFCRSGTNSNPDCSTKIHLIDLQHGTQEVILSGKEDKWYYFDTDPVHQVVLFHLKEGESGRPAGIYQFDLHTRTFRNEPIVTEDFWNFFWKEEWQAFGFSTGDPLTLNDVRKFLIRFSDDHTYNIEEITPPKNVIEPSPDGNWSVAEIDTEWYIVDKDMNRVQRVVKSAYYTWSPDSDHLITFTTINENGKAQYWVYSKDQNWSPRLAVDNELMYEIWSYWVNP